MTDMLVFGYVGDATSASHDRIVAFAVAVSKLFGGELAICKAHSYTELTELVQHRKVDVAWLPPIPFIALERFDLVVPLVTLHRGGHAEFYSVLIVPADAKVENPRALKGKRAAWVDPHSASGYVLPRIGLLAVGLDPRKAFRAEKFFGSHEAVVRAVIEGRADFGATHATVDASGKVLRATWLELPGAEDAVRVLATFGAIPADLVAARSDLEPATRDALARALVSVSSDPVHRPMLGEIFGVDAFREWSSNPGAYEEFKKATADAASKGLLEGEEKGKL